MTRKGNYFHRDNVVANVKHQRLWLISLLFAVALGAVSSDYLSAKKKFDQIASDQLKSGARVELSARELNAYVQQEVPEGVRNAKVEITSPGVATGAALVDFGKVRRAQGYRPGWLMSKLLDGERPVSVTARITSANGQTRVDVQRVEIGGIVVDGKTLDFLIQNLLIPLYPNAVVGQPFEMGHHIDRLEVRPAAVGVVIGK